MMGPEKNQSEPLITLLYETFPVKRLSSGNFQYMLMQLGSGHYL